MHECVQTTWERESSTLSAEGDSNLLKPCLLMTQGSTQPSNRHMRKHTLPKNENTVTCRELTWGHQRHSSAQSVLDPGSSSYACSSSVHRCGYNTSKGISAHKHACMHKAACQETTHLVFKLAKSFQVSRPVSSALQLDLRAENKQPCCRAALTAKCCSTH